MNDRFAGRGFWQQVPDRAHIADFAPFPLKCVIEFRPPRNLGRRQRARTERRAYLAERGCRVCEVRAVEAESKIVEVLDKLSAVVPGER